MRLLVVQLFFGVHGGRLFSGRMRRGAQFQDITYESMLALDEDNPRRAVKAHVLNSLHKVHQLLFIRQLPHGAYT